MDVTWRVYRRPSRSLVGGRRVKCLCNGRGREEMEGSVTVERTDVGRGEQKTEKEIKANTMSIRRIVEKNWTEFSTCEGVI